MKLDSCFFGTPITEQWCDGRVGKAVSYFTKISIQRMASRAEIWVSFGREFLLLMLILLKVIHHLIMLEENFMSARLDKDYE